MTRAVARFLRARLCQAGDFDRRGMAAWARPAPATDKLYMSLGGGDMIEVR